MNAKITYTDEPLGNLQVIADFLPAPEELVFRDDTVKITITLSRSSVEFFKREAKKHHTQYQKMIRRLLDVYTQKHQQLLTKRCTGRGPQRRAGELHRSCDTKSRCVLLDAEGSGDPVMMSCHRSPHGGGVTGNGGASSTQSPSDQ